MKTDGKFKHSLNLLSWRANRYARRAAAGMLAAAVIRISAAQTPAPPVPAPESKMVAPAGYSLHQSIDLGGRVTNQAGSKAMYDTLVNAQTGPRVQGETFELRALPGTKGGLVDVLTAFGSGFGGDANDFARLNASKGKLYEFSGTFRRDRQYFDYDLLGNPNIPGGQSIPIGPTATPTGAFAWPQVTQSPVLFNTVRRMTDTNLTILPLSKVSYRAGYSQNVFEGPSLSPGVSSNYFAESIGANDQLLEEYTRNSTDDFFAAVEVKIARATRISFEEQLTHFKGDSYFTLAPSQFTLQEADGTPVAIGGWDSLTPYGASNCNTTSMGGAPMLSAPNQPGGLPVLNAACAAAVSYLRSQPTRAFYPVEILRLQSADLHNITMNGNIRYSMANTNLPSYYENFTGLDGAVRAITFTGQANAKRQVIAADYGVVWQLSPAFSLSEQADFSSAHQPGYANLTAGATMVIPATAIAAGQETLNYNGPLTAGKNTIVEGNPNGTPLYGYFGQLLFSNNLTASWDATSRTVLSLTWRTGEHVIAQGDPHNQPLAVGSTNDGTVTIHENGGIFSAAFRPSSTWDVNGSVEALFADNAFTPVSPRQSYHYRFHTKYRLRPAIVVYGAFNDLERHNNTNNNQAAVSAGDDPYEGPINHVDHSRVVSVGAVIAPAKLYSLDFDYAYSDVYAATNICYDNGGAPTLPGTASTNSSGGPNVCPGVYQRGSTTALADWFARDFMDAPTQHADVALTLTPNKALRSGLGYRLSAVRGSQFFNDARGVNGSLDSTYQSPFFNVAWTPHRGLTWKAEYNFFGYGEGGPSGPEYCSTSTSLTSTVVPCASLPYPTGLTEPTSGLTAARTFHANNVTLGVHYEF